MKRESGKSRQRRLKALRHDALHREFIDACLRSGFLPKKEARDRWRQLGKPRTFKL
jgi:hypothetical protein